MKQFIYTFLCLLASLLPTVAQTTFPRNGVYDEREGLYAFTNATIFVSPKQKVENATLLIRKGVVEAVGASVTLPKGAVVVDMKGKFIYPSFIDLYTSYGLPEPQRKETGHDQPPQMLSDKKGAFGWNQAIKPEIKAGELFSPDDKAAKSLRELGFGTVLTHQKDGIARGTSALVLLATAPAHECIVSDNASAHYSFSKGKSTQDYPDSQMGAIALLRQTYLDAQWYDKAKNAGDELNLSLDAWNKSQNLPQIFETNDVFEALRADRIGDEFGKQFILKVATDAYQRLADLKATNANCIVSINFPDAYDVEDPLDAYNVDLAAMKHWELAPAVLAELEKAGINFAISTAGLQKTETFHQKLREAIKRGLSEEAALSALTTAPAALLGLGDKVGTLEKGKVANFLIASGNIFDEKTDLYENWVKGKSYLIKEIPTLDLRGTYTLKIDDLDYKLNVTGDKANDIKMELISGDSLKIPLNYTLSKPNITLSFDATKDTLRKQKAGTGYVRLSGWISPDGKQWQGNGQNTNGKWTQWTVVPRTDPANNDKKDDKKEDKKDDKKEEYGKVNYPFGGYGFAELPKAETVLFKNASVWTNEKEGILQNADVLIKDGKIAQVGKDLSAATGTKTIDAKGKHLTCGMIDEHSHIAISQGVNEGTQASSAEVRIGDVIYPNDINIYRQLSGGVTTSQLLHGSANPIGGQSAIIKLRWGFAPEKMKFENADPFIKFALGENVKQSNWGDNNTVRFPQTRMGVEQTYMDYFTRAREYGQQNTAGTGNKASAKASTPTKPFRRDLELEALNEILNKKRFITCHSYVQSEITMLMRVAEKFDFRINTFTHILEGYKVADKMKAHGVNASSFSDWWAYKYEVIDAIPHNGAILHNVGVNVAFNSDDAEMARRLNQEAAKAVKYGGVSPEEAWKFVTLNPAKMLHIDQHVGSIKAGKDADLVLWNDNPLSIYARPEQTYIDGICFFDIQRDLQLQKEISQERNRLIQKMIGVKKGGGVTQKPAAQKRRQYHCTDKGSHEYIDIYGGEQGHH